MTISKILKPTNYSEEEKELLRFMARTRVTSERRSLATNLGLMDEGMSGMENGELQLYGMHTVLEDMINFDQAFKTIRYETRASSDQNPRQ